MEPWTVVTTLSVLAALAAAVGGPLVKLNGTIARLSAMLEHVLHRLDMLEGEDRNLRRKWEETQCQLGGRVSHCENRLPRWPPRWCRPSWWAWACSGRT